MPTTLYGFKSCDTVRNALKWLDGHGVAYEFFDYRKEKLDPRVVDGWFGRAGWETVFNRNSTSFKELPAAKAAKLDQASAMALILEDTNMIKRPVLDTGDRLYFGFKPAVYAEAFGK